MAEERSDEELMRTYVENNDAAAFRVLFERYGPQLLRLARRHLRNEDEAKEIVQQTFFKLHGARNDFRQGSRLRPWIMTIAMNLVREQWRRRKRRKTSAMDVDDRAAPMPERGSIETAQRAQMLRDALSKLPDTQREVVELHWFQEQPFKEIAEIVGSTEGAVRVRAHRAYNRLRGLLEKELA